METGMQNSDVVLNALFIDQVYERLLDSISFGELKPGMRVRQSRLAEQLGVSRQPISHALQLLATLSRQTNLSVGCYCEDEARCHRSVLRELLREAGADLA